ncbi:serine/threonine protein kinase [Mucilaginibacter psychrotolerans]|uniref:Serine/threonine protein kinase n=1 Tax=Mucilaginibacter psychrotolerans TaxID=1524096 RepID=A0A4Y8SKC1_9SPHI|nr:serine/threonine-protein kinase [Mucilaginibacter psychrotolerans]TFF39302.1 serine/threonine protein kinase [Mucilaginibacter psychrotolerans]
MSKVFTIAEGLENLGALRTGGQGSVYKGKRTGTIYSAVKLIPTPIHTESGDDKNYRNFQNEVAKLQKVNEIPNPNIVKILSWGVTESGSFPYIEMEYIDGPDLNELLAPPHEKIFSLKELLKVADQLACALAHCHKVGVKHGDIKSNNVKYNIHTGNYVLLDFGLAIMSEEQRRSSIRHAGAVEFMAPEQHEGKMLLQTDIYSYGVIVYELLTGEVPFPLTGEGDSGRNAVMLGHMEAEVPDAIRARKLNLPEDWPEAKMRQEMQVPAWLINLINKCLQKKPEDRFADGPELHDAIVTGSLSATAGTVGTGIAGVSKANIDVLKTENKRLQQQILELQTALSAETIEYEASQMPDNESKITVSKLGFNALVALLVLFIGFSVYAAFYKKDARLPKTITQDSLKTPTDTPAQTPVEQQTDLPANDAYERKRIRDSIKHVTDSIRQAVIDSTTNAERDKVQVDTPQP